MMTIIKMHNSDGTARHCLPILQTDNSGIWEKLETARLVLDDAFKQACNALGIQAYVGRGNKFERPVQVFFECWIPAVEDPFLTERVWAQVTVEAMPYHQFELEYTVNIFNRGRTKELGTFGALDASQVHALVSRLVQNAKLPELSNRVQKPVAGSHQASAGKKNKVTATRADIVGALLRFLLKALLIGGLAALAIGYFALSKDESAQVATMAAGGAAVVAAIILAVILNNMKVAIRNAGKPGMAPRFLTLFDSWQAVLFHLGPSACDFQQRFFGVTQAAPIPGLQCAVEQIQYRSMDSLQERQQYVLTSGRGVIYCQIYEFGTDLYIGWQSFLNRGLWLEQDVSKGIDKKTGKRIQLKTVISGTQNLTEYDVMDLNCMTEWVHAQMVSITKQLMAERQIDQEIDFKIVRGERGELNPSQANPAQSAPRKGLFKRTG